MLNKFFKRLVGLATHYNKIVGIERRHARHTNSARSRPIIIDLGREAALGQNGARRVAVESNCLGDCNERISIADVNSVDKIGAIERIMNGIATGLCVSPRAQFLSEPTIIGMGALTVGKPSFRHETFEPLAYWLNVSTREHLSQRAPFGWRVWMQGKVNPLNFDRVVRFQLFNTHGTEVTPGSDVIGEDV